MIHLIQPIVGTRSIYVNLIHVKH